MCNGIRDDGTRCPERSRYGYKNKPAKYCKDHKTDDMINLSGYICAEGVCIIRASYGYQKGDKKLYCDEHQKCGMDNVVSRMCLTCKKVQPTYNKPEETKPLYCSGCALEGMVNVKDNKCKTCNKIIATFGYKGGKAEYCSADQLPNMIDVTKDYCIEPECNIGASFNFRDVKPYLYCSEHALEGMVNNKLVMCTKCLKTSASYGTDGKLECCKQCKTPEMTKIRKVKRCKFKEKEDDEECPHVPSYGYENGKIEYCKKHALKNMVDLKHDMCHCGTIATFNVPGEKIGLYCKKDAKPGMIDVTAPRCDCGTTAGFGFPGQSPTKCAKDKIIGMISNPTKRCAKTPCKEIAIYGNNKAIHCEEHKEPNEYNLIEKECKSCNLLTFLNEKELCGFCDPTMIKTFRLAKQKEVKSILDANNLKYTLYDKVIDSQCGYERPDFLFDCNTHFVVIEVDENQHRQNECEDVRMFNMSQTLGMKTIFIRYNPDNYKIQGKKQVTSKKKRHADLLKCLQTMKEKKVEEIDFVSAIYLFYDDYDERTVSLEKIEPAALKTEPVVESKPAKLKQSKKAVKPSKKTVTQQPTTPLPTPENPKIISILGRIAIDDGGDTINIKPKRKPPAKTATASK